MRGWGEERVGQHTHTHTHATTVRFPRLPRLPRPTRTLPKRDELRLRTVCALPNASSVGFALNIACSTPYVEHEPAVKVTNWRIFFVASVLPDPLSPEIITL